MAERFTADLLFILFVLLIAALLGYLIGWYLERGRCKKRIAVLDAEIESLKAKIQRLVDERTGLEAKVRQMDDGIASLKLTIDRQEKELAVLKTELEEALKIKGTHGIADLPADAAMPLFSPEKIKTDDLKVVNGIGPKIAKLLINRGITTWKTLSETSPNYLTAILHEDGGEHFRIHNPESWPHQALLLHEGRWDEFRELLEKLEG
jgi:predicted flap endonuclease-1-like 5' DNA nuclease